jgi:hypothetical protein
MKSKTIIRLESEYAARTACARILGALRDPDTTHEVIVQPARSQKTLRQLRTWHLWGNEAANTDIEEFAGHDKQWWHHRWKIRHYLPLLETQAAADGDDELLGIFEGWRNLYRDAAPERKQFVLEQLAENSALSFSHITLDHMILVMDAVQAECAGKGILLTQPEPDHLGISA